MQAVLSKNLFCNEEVILVRVNGEYIFGERERELHEIMCKRYFTSTYAQLDDS